MTTHDLTPEYHYAAGHLDPRESTRFTFVPGRPYPQGSKTYKGHRGGKPILVESSQGCGPWRETIRAFARRSGGMLPPSPVAVNLSFVMPRPKGTPKRQPTPPAVKRPDIDKLARAVLDAITGTWIADDSHVVTLHITKRIAELDENPGVAIKVQQLAPAQETA